MSLEIQSLAGRPTSEQPQEIQTVLVKTPDGVFHIDASMLFTFFQTNLRERVEYLELGSEGPMYWPIPRKLTLDGAVSGEVIMDGSADMTMSVTIPAGSFPINAVNGLSTELLNLRIDVDSKADADHTHKTPIESVTTATYADLTDGISIAESDSLEYPVQYGAVLTLNCSANRVGQLIIGSQSDDMYFRGYRLGAWGAARRVWHSGNFDPHNLVGDVVLAGDLLPDADNIRSLGAPGRVWRDVYIGPGSLYINDQKVMEDTGSGAIRITADPNQNIAIQTKGTGDIELNPLGTGVIQLKAPVMFQAGELIRSSNGSALIFDDSITFSPGEGIKNGLLIDGSLAWHAGNFNPAAYVAIGSSARVANLLVGSGDAMVYESAAGELGIRTGTAGAYKYFNFYANGQFRAMSHYVTGAVLEADSATAGLKVKISNKVGFHDNGIANTVDLIGQGDTTQAFVRFGNSGKGFGWNGASLVFGSDIVYHAGNFNPSSKLDVGGTAFAANKLATARSFTIGGVVKATAVNFDGQSNVALTTTVDDGALSIAKTAGLQSALDTILPVSQKGVAGGVATLDENAKIPADQLPSYVDDVLEYGTLAVFPAVGERGKLYLALDSNLLYRWTDSTYVNISSGSGIADSALKWQTARTITLGGKAAGSVNIDGSADVTLNVTGLTVTKSEVGLANVDNTSDANKPVSTAQQSALDLKAPLTGVGAYGNWPIGVTGNAATATKLATPRAISMTGVMTAPGVNFDGSAAIQLTSSIADGALSIAKTAGLQASLDSAFRNNGTLAGTDLNTALTAGIYAMGSGNTNGPVGDPDGYTLTVLRPTGSTHVTQWMTRPDVSALYIRSGNSSTGVFTAWEQVYTSYNFNPGNYQQKDQSIERADRWTTARVISLTGSATGSVSIDGSADVSLAVTINKSGVGLGNVDNTSDLNKPVSTATQSALDGKAPLTGGGTSGTWPIGITGVSGGSKPTSSATASSDLDSASIALTSFNGNGLVGAPVTGNVNYLMSTHMGGNYVSTAIAMGHSGGLNDLYVGVANGASADYLNRTWTWKKLWNESNFDPTSKLDVTGIAAAATKLATARQFSLTGPITATAVGFDGSGNVALTTAVTDGGLTIAKTSGLQSALDAKVSSSLIGVANGIVPLGADSKIAALYLPSYVDDVIEAANFAALPATGETGKIYITLDDNKTYRWGGSAYVVLTSSPGSSDAIPEGSVNLYYTNARALAAITGGASSIATANLTANRALVSDASGKVAVSAVTNTQLGYLSGVTSAVQTQLDGKTNAAASSTTATDLPTSYQNNAVTAGALTAGHPHSSGVGTVSTVRSNSDNRVAQMAYQYGGGSDVPDAWFRTYHATNGGGGWTNFYKLWHSGNFDPSLKANLGSPNFTGVPTAPTAAAGTNTTQLATTAFVTSGMVGALVHRGLLPDTANLNDYQTTGIWHQNLNAQAATGTNYPIALAGMLRVYAVGTFIYQEYMCYSTNSLYRRGWYSTSWSPWYEILDTRNTGGGFIDVGSAQNINGLKTFTNKLDVTFGNLGGTAGNYIELANFRGSSANVQQLSTRLVRRFDGTSWTTAAMELRARVDSSDHAFIRLGGASGDTIYLGEGTTERHSFGPTQSTLSGTVFCNGLLIADNGGGGGVAEKIRVGNDASLWDVGVAHTIGVKSLTDTNVGLLKFGGDVNTFGWNGSNLAYAGPVSFTGSLSFGAATRQMINLWSNQYGIGVQANTQYFRSGGGYFGWYYGGSHADGQLDPGTGGVLLMQLTQAGDLSVRSGNVIAAGAFTGSNAGLNPQANPQGACFRAQGNYGGGFGMTDGGYGISLHSTSGNLTFAFGSNTSVSAKAYINADGAGNFSRVFAGWDAGVAGSMSVSNWFRSTGQTGIYFSDYGGGWYMTDTTYVRAYNGRAVAAADFVLTSDERLKAGIRDFEYRGRLRPVNYVMRKDGKPDFGFIAQDVEKQYPEAVGRIGKEKIYQLSYPKLTAVLSYQVNTVEDRVEVQEAQITKLKAKTAQQGKRIQNLEKENQNLLSRMDKLEALVQQLLDQRQ